jgi:acetyl-CoA carboxylase biotin carboxyl carrier protein
MPVVPIGRIHGAVLTASVGEPAGDGDADAHRHDLYLPSVGWWRPAVRAGQIVQPGDTIGELTVLGAVHRVIAGPGARGAVVDTGARPGAVAADVAHPVLTLDGAALGRVAADEEAGDTATTGASGGLAVRAPSSGRFYGRPGPGKPAFVSPGDEIATGHTLCLLEVMKTFHRVTYGGNGLPPRARVVAIAVADEADVNHGDVLVHLEALS